MTSSIHWLVVILLQLQANRARRSPKMMWSITSGMEEGLWFSAKESKVVSGGTVGEHGGSRVRGKRLLQALRAWTAMG